MYLIACYLLLQIGEEGEEFDQEKWKEQKEEDSVEEWGGKVKRGKGGNIKFMLSDNFVFLLHY